MPVEAAQALTLSLTPRDWDCAKSGGGVVAEDGYDPTSAMPAIKHNMPAVKHNAHQSRCARRPHDNAITMRQEVPPTRSDNDELGMPSSKLGRRTTSRRKALRSGTTAFPSTSQTTTSRSFHLSSTGTLGASMSSVLRQPIIDSSIPTGNAYLLTPGCGYGVLHTWLAADCSLVCQNLCLWATYLENGLEL